VGVDTGSLQVDSLGEMFHQINWMQSCNSFRYDESIINIVSIIIIIILITITVILKQDAAVVKST